ncbi:MAG: NAD(+)/NADH kinase [Anaerovoracaceae bacterium]|jgi:NAD+ kinase
MSSEHIISIYRNSQPASAAAAETLRERLRRSGFQPCDGYQENAELLFVIGGDGTLLEAVHRYDFPDVPIIGINTGHLGFFQEIRPDQLDDFLHHYQRGEYTLQDLPTIQARVLLPGGRKEVHRGLNEVIIRNVGSFTTHLNIFLGGSFIEKFSGDGILVAAPAGSTAYNYSLGGAIVDPRLQLMQLTPIAPMNTVAYRSFTSSILLPSDLQIEIIPEYLEGNTSALLIDGLETNYRDVEKFIVEYSETRVHLLRFENYDFWNKVKSKFL